MKPLVLSTTKKWYWLFPSLLQFAIGQGISVPSVAATMDEILKVKDKTVLVEGDLLTPESIEIIKNNGNMLCSLDENDGACFLGNYIMDDRIKMIDLMFKQSGIQKEPTAAVLRISNDCNYSVEYVPFPGWDSLNYFKETNRIVPIPHTLLYSGDESTSFIPFDQKRKTGLVRGSLHFLRYHLFLTLAKCGRVDENTSFMMEDYHKPQMADRFRFCKWCIQYYNCESGINYIDFKRYHTKDCCVCDTKSWQNGVIEPNLTYWNNRCLPGYFSYTERWMKTHGQLDMSVVDKALNKKASLEYRKFIQESLFYGDYKWSITINLPPRYWQSAREKTLYLVPRHTNEHDYFPEAKDRQHYVTFSDTFEDIEKVFDITEEEHDYIVENSYQQYKKWIYGDYGLTMKVSTNLLRFILTCIEAGRGVGENDI